MESTDLLDAVVVGGGPAGLTAGLYLRRFLRRCRVLDGGQPRALRIERSWNVPGFPGGIGGAALLARLRQQFEDLDGSVEAAQVVRLERADRTTFRLLASDGRAWSARRVLLATGAVDHTAGLPGEDTLRAQGLLRQCPVCDGHEHAGQHILVIGAGDHGAREALFLRHFSEHVMLALPPQEPPPSRALQAALARHGVALLSQAARALRTGDAGSAVTLEDSAGGLHAFDVVYAGLGCHPRAELARTLGAGVDDGGNLNVDRHCMTDVAGLYAAGDVTGGLDQISVAVGQAAIAATAMHNSL